MSHIILTHEEQDTINAIKIFGFTVEVYQSPYLPALNFFQVLTADGKQVTRCGYKLGELRAYAAGLFDGQKVERAQASNVPVWEQHRARIEAENERMPAALRAVMTGESPKS